MSTMSTTSRLLRVYADRETWRRDHDEAKMCLDIEEQMAWGVHLWRGVLDLEVRSQAQALKKSRSATEQLLELIPIFYQMWTDASEFYLERALEFVRKGYEVDGVARFRAAVEEARCLVDNLNFEEEIRPIGELIERATPDNPRPTRYRD